MGRTVLPFTQALYLEESSWKEFRRALRKEDRELLDELFAAARYHTAACACSGRPVPLEAILVSILVEQRRAINELSRRLDALCGAAVYDASGGVTGGSPGGAPGGGGPESG